MANLAEEFGTIVSVNIENVELPLPHDGLRTIDLSRWNGASDSAPLVQLLMDIARLVGRPPHRKERELIKFIQNWRSDGALSLIQFPLYRAATANAPIQRIVPLPPPQKIPTEVLPTAPIADGPLPPFQMQKRHRQPTTAQPKSEPQSRHRSLFSIMTSAFKSVPPVAASAPAPISPPAAGPAADEQLSENLSTGPDAADPNIDAQQFHAQKRAAEQAALLQRQTRSLTAENPGQKLKADRLTAEEHVAENVEQTLQAERRAAKEMERIKAEKHAAEWAAQQRYQTRKLAAEQAEQTREADKPAQRRTPIVAAPTDPMDADPDLEIPTFLRRQARPFSTAASAHIDVGVDQYYSFDAPISQPSSNLTVPPPDLVAFGVSHPAAARAEQPIVVQAWIFTASQRDTVVARVTSNPEMPLQFQDHGPVRVPHGARITLRLTANNARVTPASQHIIWSGGIAAVSFRIEPDPAARTELITARCSISAGGLRLGTLDFQVRIQVRPDDDPAFNSTHLVRTAFASYATRDRFRVLPRVQGIEKLGVRVIMDARDFRAGRDFATAITSAISSSDTLYLFWSRHAARSEWVKREWQFAMARKGADFIDPVPLVDPRKVPPPAELVGSKHFNDWVLAYLAYEEASSPWIRVRSWLGLY